MLGTVLRAFLEPRARRRLGLPARQREVKFWFHGPGIISSQVRQKMLDHIMPMKESVRCVENHQFNRSWELNLGGRLTVSSDEEHGTAFSVRLPVADGIVFTQRHYHATHASWMFPGLFWRSMKKTGKSPGRGRRKSHQPHFNTGNAISRRVR